MMKSLKIQSAMEYLMTYGWAILIIAVTITVAFSLAANSGNPLPTACESVSGYLCTNIILHNSVLTMNIGQNTGFDWTGATIYYVTQANSSSFNAQGDPTQIINQPNQVDYVTPSGIRNGQTVTVTIPSPIQFNAGQTLVGTIWAAYTLKQTGATVYYTKIATILIKAT